MADNEEAHVEVKQWVPTRRGGKSRHRKVRREERIRAELAETLAAEQQALEVANIRHMSDSDQTELLQKWASGNLAIPDVESYGPENREPEPSKEDVTAAEEALKVESKQEKEDLKSESCSQGSMEEPSPSSPTHTVSSKTEMPSPTDFTSPTEETLDAPQAAPELHMGAPGASHTEPKSEESAKTTSKSSSLAVSTLQPPLEPKELPPKPRQSTTPAASSLRYVGIPNKLQTVAKPKPKPPQRVPEPANPPKRRWPDTAASSSTAIVKAPRGPPPRATGPPPSFSRLHANDMPPVRAVLISDLHKVLDTDRGHIRRSFSLDFRKLWSRGIRVEIISYIGRDSDKLREDAREKVKAFNDFLYVNVPEYCRSEYMPVPLWIADYRTMNGGKLSLVQTYYQQEEGDPPVIGVVDDAPDVCYEVESGNIRAYRIWGGRLKHQRHEPGFPVFRNFSEATHYVIEDFEAGVIPYRPIPDGPYGMRRKKGVLQLPGR